MKGIAKYLVWLLLFGCMNEISPIVETIEEAPGLEDIDLNQQTDLDQKLLDAVQHDGDEQEIVDLLAQGADPNAMDFSFYNYTPLHLAAAYGNEGAVRALVEGGADVGAQSALGATPLHAAAGKGDSGVIAYLLEQGAGVNAQDEGNRTPLHIAYFNKNMAAVDTLLAYEADVEALDARGHAPIFYLHDNNKE